MFNKKKKNKIFCVSMQRTGTTSVGEFFRLMGFDVATFNTSFKNHWTNLWYDGNYEDIFNSKDFKNSVVFEDDPWWCPEFYKYLYHRFPQSKFILFEREPEKWFQSMLNHSEGKTLGNTRLHCKIYRREIEFYRNIDNYSNFTPTEFEIDNLLTIKGYESYYCDIYRTYNREVKEFFQRKSPESLFTAELEDPQKWKKLGKFINIEVPENFNVHAGKSKA